MPCGVGVWVWEGSKLMDSQEWVVGRCVEAPLHPLVVLIPG